MLVNPLSKMLPQVLPFYISLRISAKLEAYCWKTVGQEQAEVQLVLSLWMCSTEVYIQPNEYQKFK